MTAPDTLPPELAELGELLREAPPRPDRGWASGLDARMRAGFPKPARRSPWELLKPYRRALVPVVSFACVALLVVGLPLMGVSSDDSGSGGGGAAGGGAAGLRETSRDQGGEGAASSAAPPASEDSAAAPKMAPAPGGGSPRSDGRTRR